MLLNFDAKQLEWRAIAHLANDEVALEEITNGVDTHSDNQKRFNLPERVIAKIFLFRAIFKGSAYAYSVDNDFKHVSTKEAFWQDVIDRFYEKYTGIYNYHNKIIQEAQQNGFLISESGRRYDFEPVMRRGKLEWPINDIVNYPVQGFSADLMSLLRVTLDSRLAEYFDRGVLEWKDTVHDSVVFDTYLPLKEAVEVMRIVKKAFQDIPVNFERCYKKKLLVPMDCDAHVGINWLWQHEIKLK